MTAAAQAPCPTTPGLPFAGGFYAGRLRIDGDLHALIVAPKAGGELSGAWLDHYTDVPGARSRYNGLANTRAMAEAGSTIAQHALACRVGGFDDWHIPARDELELMYRNLKPTADGNFCGNADGKNPSSEPPGLRYDETTPAQTAAPNFRDRAAEAFAPQWYWSSTQGGRNGAFTQGFEYGDIDADLKDWSDGTARLARLIPLESAELQPFGCGVPSDFFATPIAAASIATLVAAFDRWETAYRIEPAAFLSLEEIQAMETAPLSEQRAIYFAGLLRSVA